MSRHPGFPATTGFPRNRAHVNTFWSELTTRSASVDVENLAPEGLDVRNFGNEAVFEMRTDGARRHYAEFAGPSTIVGATAAYRAEALAAYVIGGNPCQLDWGAGYTLGSDEVLVVKGTVAFGTPTLGGQVTGGSTEAGVSAIIVVDLGAGYAAWSPSRSGRKGLQQVGGGAVTNVERMQMDAFDLTPMAFITSGTIQRIGISVGTTLVGAGDSFNIGRMQLHTYILKKAR